MLEGENCAKDKTEEYKVLVTEPGSKF